MAMGKDQIKEWALKIMRSAETVEQAFTALRLMELAGHTECEEYKQWSQFRDALGWTYSNQSNQ
tara:strand:- start:835 stop:1026 length:192 start_codon:yes stop_codon:yes gene_type:complete